MRAGLPVELTSRARWVRHNRHKVPLTVTGGAASSTDPATWSRFVEVSTSQVGVGRGFVLNGDGVVCIDIDHCLDGEGRPSPAAAAFLEGCPDTFVEVSPGGDGLHVWGFAGGVTQGRVVATAGGLRVEVYGWGRYMTVTGRAVPGCSMRLADLSGVVRDLLGR